MFLVFFQNGVHGSTWVGCLLHIYVLFHEYFGLKDECLIKKKKGKMQGWTESKEGRKNKKKKEKPLMSPKLWVIFLCIIHTAAPLIKANFFHHTYIYIYINENLSILAKRGQSVYGNPFSSLWFCLFFLIYIQDKAAF